MTHPLTGKRDFPPVVAALEKVAHLNNGRLTWQVPASDDAQPGDAGLPGESPEDVAWFIADVFARHLLRSDAFRAAAPGTAITVARVIAFLRLWDD